MEDFSEMQRELDIPSQMDYQDKLRAIGMSKPSMHVIQDPESGSQFLTNTGKINFIISNNQVTKFADLRNMYMAFNISANVANTSLTMGENGTMALAAKIRVSTRGNRLISEISKKNVLDSAFVKMSKSTNWQGSTGNVLYGAATTFAGGVITGVINKYRYIMPLDKLGFDENFLNMACREDLKIEITLDSALNILVAQEGGVASANCLTLSECSLHYDVLSLSNQEYEEILAMTGGKFVMSSTAYTLDEKIITATDTTVSMNLAAGKTRVKRIFIVQRGVNNEGVLVHDKFSMGTGSATEISIVHNSVELKNRPYSMQEGTNFGNPEILCESIKSAGGSIYDNIESIGDATRTLLSGDVNATTLPTSGTFVAVFDCQNGYQVDGVTSSGIDITSGNTVLKISRVATTNNAYLEAFYEYQQDIVLDTLGSNTLEIYS